MRPRAISTSVGAARVLVVLVALLAVQLGCGRASFCFEPVSTQPATLGSERTLRVGVKEIDITPPPGLSLFGHGPESRVATGTQLRLRCRIFVLVGPSGPADSDPLDAVALVPCDLLAPSLALSRAVASSVAKKGTPLGADRIVLMATHTHFGPAHYFASSNLSGPMSSRVYGYDGAVVSYLAERIACGIHEAYQQRAPGRAVWGFDRTLLGLGRNRSLAAFARNPAPLPDKLGERLRDPVLREQFSPAELATDPQLSVLRIDRWVRDPAGKAVGFLPLGAFAVFGLHPTAIDADNDLYSGDIFGYATRAAADAMARTVLGRADGTPVPPGLPPVVVGLANGIEGDVTSSRDAAGPREARRIGAKLGARIVALWRQLAPSTEDAEAQPGSPSTVVRARYRDLWFPGAPAEGSARLCLRPELGAAAAGGASDHPTQFRPWMALHEGVRQRTERPCHGPRVPFQPVTGHGTLGSDFPVVGPISLVRIGNGLLATVPAEPTTVTGLRIRDALRLVVEQAPDPTLSAGITGIAIAGLTHEYLQYVATAEEYDLQDYEGASTLYGPATAGFLAMHHACLARTLFSPQSTPDAACSAGQFCPPDDPEQWLSHQSPRSCDNPADKVCGVSFSVSPALDRLEPPPKEASLLEAAPSDAPREVLTRDGRRGWEITWQAWTTEARSIELGKALDLPPERLSVVRLERATDAVQAADAPAEARRWREISEADDDGVDLEVRYLPDNQGSGRWCALWTPEPDPGDPRCGQLYRLVVSRARYRVSSCPFELVCGRPSRALPRACSDLPDGGAP